MRQGFRVEEHVVVYCDCCGDHYTENDSEALCFDSISQAIAYITHCGSGVGWTYDGDRVLCDGCVATEKCNEHGHVFTDHWQVTRHPAGTATRSRTCDRCGVPEIEVIR